MRLWPFIILLALWPGVARSEILSASAKETLLSERAEVTKEQVVLKKWGGEAKLYLKSPLSTVALEKDGDTLKQSSTAIEVRIYELSPNAAQYENGGIEYEIVLNRKPLRNHHSIDVDTDNLTWHYQPALTHDEEYDWIDDHPEGAGEYKVRHRDENVIGSYAVYHSSKIDGKYKAGKAFHVFRPKVIDAKGNWAWAEYNTDVQSTKKLTITIPQKFLDDAVYPVIIDPTIGDTDGGASCQTGVGSPGVKITMPANGDVTSISASVCEACGTARAVYGEIYTNSSGAPASLVACGNVSAGLPGSCSSCNNAAYRTSNITASLTSGTVYWLAAMFNNSAWCYHIEYDSGSSGDGYDRSQTGTSCEATASSGTSNDRIYSIYATYTETTVAERRFILVS